MASYVFQNASHTSALRTADDDMFYSIPWSTDPVQPLDVDGELGRLWIEDGSPVPDPYVEPEPVPPVPTQAQALAFDHENRILALEGQPPLTMADFITKMIPK
jgi:hypothetical protein